MSFYCPHCNTENSADYEWRGMTIPCAACSREMKLEYRTGQSIPAHAYEVTFQDFSRLVQTGDSRQTAHPLIVQLLDCRIESYSGRFVLRHKGGGLIPLEVAHLRIQSDPVKQRELYNMAMTLWR